MFHEKLLSNSNIYLQLEFVLVHLKWSYIETRAQFLNEFDFFLNGGYAGATQDRQATA